MTFGDKRQWNAQFNWLIDVCRAQNEEGAQEILVIVEDVTHGI